MKLCIQRVSRAKVTLPESGRISGQIGRGLLVLLGVGHDDTGEIARHFAKKVLELRIFEDEAGKMNRSLLDVGGEILVVSQFTLYADTRKGRRPSFTEAAPPELAESIYEMFIEALAEHGLTVARGVFRTEMQIELVNDGPVTLIME